MHELSPADVALVVALPHRLGPIAGPRRVAEAFRAETGRLIPFAAVAALTPPGRRRRPSDRPLFARGRPRKDGMLPAGPKTWRLLP
jgi:hypothetical protein